MSVCPVFLHQLARAPSLLVGQKYRSGFFSGLLGKYLGSFFSFLGKKVIFWLFWALYRFLDCKNTIFWNFVQTWACDPLLEIIWPQNSERNNFGPFWPIWTKKWAKKGHKGTKNAIFWDFLQTWACDPSLEIIWPQNSEENNFWPFWLIWTKNGPRRVKKGPKIPYENTILGCPLHHCLSVLLSCIYQNCNNWPKTEVEQCDEHVTIYYQKVHIKLY